MAKNAVGIVIAVRWLLPGEGGWSELKAKCAAATCLLLPIAAHFLLPLNN